MTETIRKLGILIALATYRVLTRRQIQDLAGYVGAKHDDRACRRDLLELVQAGLISRARMEVINPSLGAPAPVYSITRKGLEMVAAETGDETLLDKDLTPVNWTLLLHASEVSEWFIRFDRAIALQNDVQCEHWLTEFDVANPAEKDPAKKYKLFTEIEKTPRLVCNPDFAFLLCYKDHKKVYYGELSRGTSGIQQIAASKTRGFAALADKRLHLKHFPESTLNTFTVLFIEPSIGRRNLLWKALSKKPGAGLYKCAAWPEITPQSLLFEPIWFDCEGKAAPLIRRS